MCDGIQWPNVSILKVTLKEAAFVFEILSWALGLQIFDPSEDKTPF